MTDSQTRTIYNPVSDGWGVVLDDVYNHGSRLYRSRYMTGLHGTYQAPEPAPEPESVSSMPHFGDNSLTVIDDDEVEEDPLTEDLETEDPVEFETTLNTTGTFESAAEATEANLGAADTATAETVAESSEPGVGALAAINTLMGNVVANAYAGKERTMVANVISAASNVPSDFSNFKAQSIARDIQGRLSDRNTIRGAVSFFGPIAEVMAQGMMHPLTIPKISVASSVGNVVI